MTGKIIEFKLFKIDLVGNVILQIPTWKVTRCCFRKINRPSGFDHLAWMQTGNFHFLVKKTVISIHSIVLVYVTGHNDFAHSETCFGIGWEACRWQWSNNQKPHWNFHQEHRRNFVSISNSNQTGEYLYLFTFTFSHSNNNKWTLFGFRLMVNEMLIQFSVRFQKPSLPL